MQHTTDLYLAIRISYENTDGLDAAITSLASSIATVTGNVQCASLNKFIVVNDVQSVSLVDDPFQMRPEPRNE
jgi:hypothetical protein